MDQAVSLALKAMINRMVQDNLRPWLRSEMLERPQISGTMRLEKGPSPRCVARRIAMERGSAYVASGPRPNRRKVAPGTRLLRSG